MPLILDLFLCESVPAELPLLLSVQESYYSGVIVLVDCRARAAELFQTIKSQVVAIESDIFGRIRDREEQNLRGLPFSPLWIIKKQDNRKRVTTMELDLNIVGSLKGITRSHVSD